MFIGKKVKLSHYHDGDGKKFAEWQWDDAFNNPLSDDMIHPILLRTGKTYLDVHLKAKKMLNLLLEKQRIMNWSDLLPCLTSTYAIILAN